MPKPNKRFALHTEVVALAERRGEVRITSDILSWKWDEDTVTGNDFHRKLEALGDVDEITVRINSPGGSPTEAIAIRSELMRHKAVKVIEIEGLCASAATLIACLPGAKVRMAQGSEYMIHQCSTGAWGHADDLMAAYNSAMATDKNMADIYAERTGKSADECLDLMKKVTWLRPDEAVEAGFADEAVAPGEEEFEMVACAVDAEAFELMKESYAHAVENVIALPAKQVSNEQSAVAAEHSTENNNEGVNDMDELKNATAEQLQAENPALAQSITEQAVKAERERMQRIDRVTPKGAKFAKMAEEAKANGTSVEDYLAQVIEAQDKEGKDYLEARQKETAPANKVGGGDSGDNDDKDGTDQSDKTAKELADLANGMRATTTVLA